MNFKNFFMKDIQQFNESKKKINEAFNTEKKLPEQVFRQSFKNFKFEEFDWAMDLEFWNTLKKLALQTKDDFVLVAVLDPNPIEYFYKEFKYYNWIRLPIDLSVDEYYEILEYGPEESPADAILYNSYTVVWLSPSMRWAIWAEREYGICIVGFNDKDHLNNLVPLLTSWRSIDETVLSWIEANFENEEIFQKFIESLYLNYL